MDRHSHSLDQTSVDQPLVFPGRKVCDGVNDVSIRPALEPGHLVGATRDAQPAADAVYSIHNRYPILFRNRVHLTPFNTGSAPQAFVGVNDGIIVGAGHRVFDAVFGDAAQQGAAATTTVADVAESRHHIAHRMHQAHLFGFVEEG